MPRESVLREGRGREAKPSYGRQTLTDSHNGLLVERKVTGTAEAAWELPEHQSRRN